MIPGSGKIMYCAFPTRLRHMAEQVKARARAMGFAPVIPFECGAYDDFEGNPAIGRARTLRFMISVMQGCDVVGVFGISRGVMGEVKNALDLGMEIHAIYGLDPKWERFYERLKGEYGDVLRRLRGRHHLFALIGPSAIGKTYWSHRLIAKFGDRLQRIKNTTTRPPRDAGDHDSYNFISRREFVQGIAEHQFLEYDEYLGSYYGSSLTDIRNVLRAASGIFAITPAGAQALYSHRFEINLTNILLQPASPEVLLTNFARRGITDVRRRTQLLAAAERFTLPPTIEHSTVVITGDTDQNEQGLTNIIEPLLAKPLV